jgi:hypothetical protein
MNGLTRVEGISKEGQWSPRMLLVAFILANIWDSLSTFAGLSLGAVEANPILSGLMEATSVPTALTIKVFLALFLSVLVIRWKPRALVLPTLILALIALSNTLIAWTVLLNWVP